MVDPKIINYLKEAIKANEQSVTPYDATAEVVRVEDGVAWVHIPGGVDETPAFMSVSAKPGDSVRVRVANGQAWISGNETAPPTDDTEAIVAGTKAEKAQVQAEEASETAEAAQAAAESAQESAIIAAGAAASAQASADNASEYAARALGNLSTVQSVAETLNWITEHGTMTLTTDTELNPAHVYFVQDANGDYVVGGTHYSVVTEPSVSDLANYYELNIDESLTNYVGTHLAVTDEGLWVLPATTGYKVLIATGNGTTYTEAGTYIINESGDTVASFGEEVLLGNDNGTQLRLTSTMLQMTTNNIPMLEINSSNVVSTVRKTYTGEKLDSTGTLKWTINQNIAQGTALSLRIMAGETGSRWFNADTTLTYGTAETKNISITAFSCTLAYDGVNQITITGFSPNLTNPMTEVYIIVQYTVTGYAPYALLGSTGEEEFGAYAVAEGLNSKATGDYSHAESNSSATNDFAHSEGYQTTASGYASHSEGFATESDGQGSHSEGVNTSATGDAAHAEGENTVADGYYSHAQNIGTKVYHEAQTAIGKYNEVDQLGDLAFMIGNGTDDSNRSNAFTVDWNGNVDAKNLVTDVAYDSINEKFTLTIGGTTSDIVTLATLASALRLLIAGLTSKGAITDFDDATTSGFYTYANSATSRPPVNAGGTCLVLRNGNFVTQICFPNRSSSTAAPTFYIRRTYAADTWQAWYQIVPTST